MREGNTNIDESVKVKSWEAESPAYPPQHSFFNKYADPHPTPSYARASHLNQPDHEHELNHMDGAFRQLKNEQIEKLRGLKDEYEQIRRITTDYLQPKYSRQSSMGSSNIKDSSSLSPQKNNLAHSHHAGHRDQQILELEKKQLEIMLQNSMKKIEELLHTEMQNKKTIHELRLHKESKSFTDSDTHSLNRIVRKREKELQEQIQLLELEREGLLSGQAGLKEKVRYLESKLNVSDDELRKMLEEKRNYEELIRMEKDKLMNLEIEFKREKREGEIMEKDKNAEIQQLRRLKDIQESIHEKELQQSNAGLRSEITVKEERYVLLLKQIESLQNGKDKEELQRDHRDQEIDNKDEEIRLITELMGKNSSDSNNKVLQDTVTGILQRLSELETNPQPPLASDMLTSLFNFERKVEEPVKFSAPPMEPFPNNVDEVNSLEQRLQSCQHRINALTHEKNTLLTENASLKLELNNSSRKYRTLHDSEALLREQLEKARGMGRKTSRADLKERPSAKKDDSLIKLSFLTVTIKNLEDDVSLLNGKLEESNRERDRVDNENRALLTKVSLAEFEMSKTRQEADFQRNLGKREADAIISMLQKDLAVEREQHNRSKGEGNNLKNMIHQGKSSYQNEIAGLKNKVSLLERGKNSYDAQMEVRFNNSVEGINTDYQEQISKLTTTIQEVTLTNKDLQEKNNRLQVMSALKDYEE